MAKSVVTAYALNVRGGPGTSYPVLTQLRQNEMVEVLGLSLEGTWKQVRTPAGLTGWCAGQYLAAVEPEPAPDGTPSALPQARVTAYALNLRSGPTASTAILGVLRQGDTVAVLTASTDGYWTQVRTAGGLTGWASSRYLAGLPTPPPDDNATRTGFHRVSTSVLNIRTAAGLDQNVVGTLRMEDIVNVSEVSSDRAWKRITTVAGLRGWCSSQYLISLGNEGAVQAGEEFPWMPIAFGELGLREVPGSASNPNVIQYLMSTNLPDSATLPDETDWCAAFVNWCVKQAGLPGTDSAMVNPWLKWGRPLSVPRRGCIVVFRWLDGGGHVAFYTGETGAYLRALGGNQSDAVWIKSYPRAQAVGFRVPADWPD